MQSERPFRLQLTGALPYFAEVPHALWGEVNYQSEGDCRYPTDRDWQYLNLTHRGTGEWLEIAADEPGQLWVTGETRFLAARTAVFLLGRCGGQGIGEDPSTAMGEWIAADAAARAARVQSAFERPELAEFDSHLFWGGWKWVGWNSTEATWAIRWIMQGLLLADPRAVWLCIAWLQQGTGDERQSRALRSALAQLTGQQFASDRAWLDWYDRAGKAHFARPDLAEWATEVGAELLD